MVVAPPSGSRLDSEWLPCDGRRLPIKGNEALFVLMGTTFGGDGRARLRAAGRPTLDGFAWRISRLGHFPETTCDAVTPAVPSIVPLDAYLGSIVHLAYSDDMASHDMWCRRLPRAAAEGPGVARPHARHRRSLRRRRAPQHVRRCRRSSSTVASRRPSSSAVTFPSLIVIERWPPRSQSTRPGDGRGFTSWSIPWSRTDAHARPGPRSWLISGAPGTTDDEEGLRDRGGVPRDRRSWMSMVMERLPTSCGDDDRGGADARS